MGLGAQLVAFSWSELHISTAFPLSLLTEINDYVQVDSRFRHHNTPPYPARACDQSQLQTPTPVQDHVLPRDALVLDVGQDLFRNLLDSGQSLQLGRVCHHLDPLRRKPEAPFLRRAVAKSASQISAPCLSSVYTTGHSTRMHNRLTVRSSPGDTELTLTSGAEIMASPLARWTCAALVTA